MLEDSPYTATAPAVLDALHPRLRAYFGRIPDGHVGVGHGVFAVVGTPRRWLWPLLAAFSPDGVMFPRWERDVPFEVVNTPTVVRPRRDPAREARPAVRARRTFRFRSGDREMVDCIAALPSGLVDLLGRHGRLRATLEPRVEGGALRLVSTRVSFVVPGAELRLPAVVSPVVELTERFDDEAGMQRVSLVLRAPILGTLYRYEGAFTYSVVPAHRTARRTT